MYIFDQRCSAHIFNLIVQEELKIIGETVKKVIKTGKYEKKSQDRKQEFLECANSTRL